MRSALGWLAGLVGVAALVRALRRRAEPPQPLPATGTGLDGSDDPAAELRRRLDEARGDTGAAPAEPASAAEDASLAERRARVHARAQEALDLMREPPEAR